MREAAVAMPALSLRHEAGRASAADRDTTSIAANDEQDGFDDDGDGEQRSR
jgi:hypothetical protein